MNPGDYVTYYHQIMRFGFIAEVYGHYVLLRGGQKVPTSRIIAVNGNLTAPRKPHIQWSHSDIRSYVSKS